MRLFTSVGRWMRWFRGRVSGERRRSGLRVPVEVGLRLDLDEVSLRGTARDISTGGVFFETNVPLARGVEGSLVRVGNATGVPVRVAWTCRSGGDRIAGIGLEFASNKRDAR